jgi:hypothetical protein
MALGVADREGLYRGWAADVLFVVLCVGLEGGKSVSVQAISWVLEHSKSELGSRLVLISIANAALDDGTGAWPSVATLAQKSKLSERQVRYCLRKLEEAGELQTQIKSGPYGTNMYSLPKMGGAKSAPGGQSTTAGGAICDIWWGNPLPPIRPYPSIKIKKGVHTKLLWMDSGNI